MALRNKSGPRKPSSVPASPPKNLKPKPAHASEEVLATRERKPRKRPGPQASTGPVVPREKVAQEAPAEKPHAYDADTAIKLYLREIGQVKLLTPQEEIELAARIKKGDKKAREQMIKANLRLVVKIAYDYKEMGLPLMDLISEGNLGLIKAVERFDPAKGGKLSTYAAWWIKQSMKRALANQSKTIRLPVHLVDKIARMRKVIAALTDEFGREPSNEEIAYDMQMPVNKIALLKTVSVRPASLDAPVGEDSDSATLGDLVGDENSIAPDADLGERNRRENLRAMVESLDPREAAIIKMRFGLDGEKELTLEEVGRKFKVTRERIRQLEYLALSKIRRQMARHDKQRTADEIEQETRAEERAQSIRDYLARNPSDS